MRHYEHCAVLEALTKRPLNQIVSFQVDIGCSFIKDNDLVLSHDCPAEANQLSFSNAEVGTILSYLEVNPSLVLLIFTLSIVILFSLLSFAFRL